MNKKFKCQLQDCGRQAEWFNKSLRIAICKKHLALSEESHSVKIGNLEGAEETLRLVKACINEFYEASRSITIEECEEESNNFCEQLEDKVEEISNELNYVRKNKKFEDFGAIETRIKALTLELKKNQLFNKFCTQLYFCMKCEQLGVNKEKTSRFIENPLNEDLFVDQLKQKDTELKNLKGELKTIKEKVASIVGLSSQADIEKVYCIITGKKIAPKISEQLVLDCNDQKNCDFMEILGDNILPNCDMLRINNIQEHISLVENFIFRCFPQTVRCLALNFRGKPINWEKLVEMVTYLSPHITNELYLYNLKFGPFQLSNILQNTCQHIKELGFGSCILEIDTVPSLQYCLYGSRIETLLLDNFDSSECKDCSVSSLRFSNLMEGLSQSKDFVNSFKKLVLIEFCMDREDVIEILEKIGFSSVYLVIM
ncbi:unnamed protein product [Moneuplotes crassus]|uniref:Uncharacterized protein n=1 Tax=Euplotes crassus TaxID=5936 RepID=A0AAD1XPB0_EUPCR|nr:unnamed protein product [Moneuplotes crassus]